MSGASANLGLIDVSFGLDPSIYKDFMELPQGDCVQAEYVWLGGDNELRSKTKTLTGRTVINSLKELPVWNYDGSSTKQAPTESSEVLIKPARMIRDPFRRGNNIIVLCETLNTDEEPLKPFNQRADAKKFFDMRLEVEPWFGIEQEYTLFQPDNETPLGFPKVGLPPEQGQYYCSTGTGNAFGRMIADCHYRACLYAGLTISGINAEVMPGQWEYQVGPCLGIDGADQLWLSRYIMQRVCEKFVLSSLGILSPRRVIGMVLVATPITRPRLCVNKSTVRKLPTMSSSVRSTVSASATSNTYTSTAL